MGEQRISGRKENLQKQKRELKELLFRPVRANYQSLIITTRRLIIWNNLLTPLQYGPFPTSNFCKSPKKHLAFPIANRHIFL